MFNRYYSIYKFDKKDIFMLTNNYLLKELSINNVSIWIDDLSREMINNGVLKNMIQNHNVSGLTTNPTIFQNSLTEHKNLYIKEIQNLNNKKLCVENIIMEIMIQDVRNACSIFTKYKKNFKNITDGKVSIEVDPNIAFNTDKTILYAKNLWKKVDKKNLYIKIPATKQGLIAITKLISEGININVTLIFSLKRYREVINAYMLGLEKAIQNGKDISNICSVASFFISRMDVLIDDLLNKYQGNDKKIKSLQGKAAVANAKLAYHIYSEMFNSARWDVLNKFGANKQVPLWASTGVKNASYSKTMYVESLIMKDTINTMPKSTLKAIFTYHPHDKKHKNWMMNDINTSNKFFKQISNFNIQYKQIIRILEKDGIDKFIDSWNKIIKHIQSILANIS